MGMLNSMSIKRKLTAAFLLIGLFSAVVGTFGIGAIYSTNQNTKDIYSGHYIPATYLYGIQENFLRLNDTFNMMLYEKDILQVDKRSKTIEELQQRNEALMASFRDSGVSAEVYQQLEADIAVTDEVTGRLKTALESGDYSGAINIAPDFHSRVSVVDRNIQTLISDGITIADASIRESQRTFLVAFAAMIGFSVLCLTFAFLLGTYLARKIGTPIAGLADAAEKLARGDANVAVETELKDEVGHLVTAFGIMAANIRSDAEAVQCIAEGNLDIEIEPKSEEDVLGKSVQSVILNLRALVAQSAEMTEAALNGDLTCRGEEELFCGTYKDIIHGFNQTLEAVIAPLNTSAEFLQRISRGDIPELITEEYPGDFNEVRNSLNTCIHAVRGMIADVNMLSEATIEGDLHRRVDTAKHEGDFRKIVAGFNQTLDAVINPLYVSAAYIKKIGRGEIPPLMTQAYRGEFNEIKRSINSCIEGLGALSEGNQLLERMSLNDFSGQTQQTGLGIFREIAESIRRVSKNINEIIGCLNHVADGNLEDLEELKSIGQKSENDSLIPSITMMIENLKNITDETQALSKAAIEGQLEKRGAAENFQGEYRKILEGVNQTLDAVIEPVREASFVLREMAEGNLNVVMCGDYQGDHAEIKDAVNMSIRSLLNYIEEINEVLTEISRGNLDLTITGDYRGNFVEIKESLNNIIQSMTKVMHDLGRTADEVASGSGQMLDSSHTLAQGSMEQACSIEELSASITETSGHLKQSSVLAAEACGLAKSAQSSAKKGNAQMDIMLESMEGISVSSRSISKIIKVIDDIAFQTNILSLNAAVEAARAGQHGKGFALVADEVRGLAARSAEAAKQTAVIIEESIRSVNTGSEIARDTADVFHDIAETVDKVAGLTVNISESAGEQTASIIIINHGIEQVSQIVQTNSAMAEQSSAMSEKLCSQAELLAEMAAAFQFRDKPVLPEPSGTLHLLGSPGRFETAS
jgi:methyl-accepting chemotaxis protein